MQYLQHLNVLREGCKERKFILTDSLLPSEQCSRGNCGRDYECGEAAGKLMAVLTTCAQRGRETSRRDAVRVMKITTVVSCWLLVALMDRGPCFVRVAHKGDAIQGPMVSHFSTDPPPLAVMYQEMKLCANSTKGPSHFHHLALPLRFARPVSFKDHGVGVI